MTPLNSFNIYHSYLEGIEPLTYEERGRLLTALLKYSISGELMALSGGEQYVFPLMKTQIDRDKAKYLERSRRCSLNGTKGAKKRMENTLARPDDFHPPKLQDIENYCKENKLKVDPERFYRYFEDGCWLDSQGRKVKNWKQKLMTWNLYEREQSEDCPDSSPAKFNLEELKRSIDKI